MKKLIFTILILGLAFAGYQLYPFLKKPLTVADLEPRTNAEELKQLLFAVVIDNAPEARPQAGLDAADMVFETLAEGGATRFLAFYSAGPGRLEVEKIGPVRSARPYFIDWALAFGVPLAHSGGSREALERIAGEPSIKDINEFYQERYFWRDKARSAPHNLFTSTKLMKELIEKKKWSNTSPVSFLRKPAFGTGRQESSGSRGSLSGMTTEISVNFSPSSTFRRDFKYDESTNSYGNGVKNVVVLHTTSRVIDKNLLTIDLLTSGSGKAQVFRDGQVLQVRWRKQGRSAPLELLDADGTKVELNQGQTWFAVLDQGGSVTTR